MSRSSVATSPTSTATAVPKTAFPQGEGVAGELLTRAIQWRWPLWIAAALLVYYPTFQTRPVFDDMGHVEFVAQQGWHLLHMGPLFFRPIERILIGINWLLCGDNFWLVKVVTLAILVAKTAVVYDLAARITAPSRTWAPWVIALIFLLHPMHVSAVGKIDTLSEDIAALFTLLLVRFAIVAAGTSDRQQLNPTHLRCAIGAATMVFLGMMSKEAFAGIAAATPLLFAIAIGISRPESRRVLRYLIASEAVAAVVYFAARHAAGFSLTGARIDATRYKLQFGSNVLVNVGAEMGSIAFPGSTLAVFVDFNATHVAISLGLLVALVILLRRPLATLALRMGSLPAKPRRMTQIVLLAIVAASFPACLISEVISENQTALALPFVLLLVLACPLAVPPAPSANPVQWRRLAGLLSGIAIVWMAGATADKVLAARATSIHTYRIGDEIVAKFQEHPKAALTVCFGRSMRSEPKKYSVFSMPDDLAAYFQLFRLKALSPAPVVTTVDLRLKNANEPQHCDLTIDGTSVTAD